jgi:hypothetical protein
MAEVYESVVICYYYVDPSDRKYHSFIIIFLL